MHDIRMRMTYVCILLALLVCPVVNFLTQHPGLNFIILLPFLTENCPLPTFSPVSLPSHKATVSTSMPKWPHQYATVCKSGWRGVFACQYECLERCAYLSDLEVCIPACVHDYLESLYDYLESLSV